MNDFKVTPVYGALYDGVVSIQVSVFSGHIHTYRNHKLRSHEIHENRSIIENKKANHVENTYGSTKSIKPTEKKNTRKNIRTQATRAREHENMNLHAQTDAARGSFAQRERYPVSWRKHAISFPPVFHPHNTDVHTHLHIYPNIASITHGRICAIVRRAYNIILPLPNLTFMTTCRALQIRRFLTRLWRSNFS